jgi:hypothetical protein
MVYMMENGVAHVLHFLSPFLTTFLVKLILAKFIMCYGSLNSYKK